jgi:hypothetical protein
VHIDNHLNYVLHVDKAGLYSCSIQCTHSLQAPGFNLEPIQ